MIVVGSSYIAVIAYVHGFPQTLEIVNDRVNVLLGSNALLLCLELDFLTVLIGTCQEHYVVTLHSLESRNSVTGYGSVAVTDMRISRRIINRGGYIEFFAHF